MAAAKTAETPRNPPSSAAAAAIAVAKDAPQAEDIVDPRVHVFCDILSRVPLSEVEAFLTASGRVPLPEIVEAVLRRSYSNPHSAIQFFRWSGLSMRHSPYAWNLMVDILGKNGLFDAMWDAIRSMKQETALSPATFFSAFSSYCSAGRIKEAVMTFDVMDRYDVKPDVVAVNSLLSAICRREGRTADAADFLDRVKSRIHPDADSFAILLEGWEKEGNLARAKTTFGEMVISVGWDAGNMSAYDAFLATLVRGAQAGEALKFLKVMKAKNCLPGLKFFTNALDILIKQNDRANALALWDIMVGDSGLVPNLAMYSTMIALLANNCDLDSAYRLLDDMPFRGVFPDSITYNTIFGSLIRNRRTREAERFLAEMRKNEQLPLPSNCAAAIKMFFDEYDPSAAIEVWNCVVEEGVQPDEECADELLIGLRDLGRLREVRKYAEDMIDRGIVLRSSTMERLKTAFYKARKEDAYDHISRRMKQRQDRDS